MKLISIKKSSRSDKRLMALFEDDNRKKTVHFGLRGGSTFIDHKDEDKKKAYIARHQVNEDWSQPDKAGTLSRYILWNKPTLEDSIRDYTKRFNLA